MMEPVAYITEEMIQYAKRYGGMCRDCADENGICPTSGIACGGRDAAVRFTANAINYGIKNGFVRLSDAEARTKELEAAIEQMKADHACEVADMATRFRAVNVDRLSEQLGADIFALRDRAEAAEALLKEQEADDASLLSKLKVMRGIYAMQKEEYTSRALHNIITEFEASRAARAIHDKIGVKDE